MKEYYNLQFLKCNTVTFKTSVSCEDILGLQLVITLQIDTILCQKNNTGLQICNSLIWGTPGPSLFLEEEAFNAIMRLGATVLYQCYFFRI